MARTVKKKAKKKKKYGPWDMRQFPTHKGARGNPDFWASMAYKIKDSVNGDNQAKNLKVLGLKKMPSSLDGLKRAWKRKLRKIHPDLGGSHEQATEVNRAYKALEKIIK